MRNRWFWSSFLLPTVMILAGFLISMLLMPVGTANWTETLWVTGSIHPGNPDAIPTGGCELIQPTLTNTPEPTKDPIKTEDSSDLGKIDRGDPIDLPVTPEPEETSS